METIQSLSPRTRAVPARTLTTDSWTVDVPRVSWMNLSTDVAELGPTEYHTGGEVDMAILLAEKAG